MMWGNCERKQVLLWASSCKMNSYINQLLPSKNHFHLSFQLHNKIIYALCNLILQPMKLQELYNKKDSYTCQTTKVNELVRPKTK